MKIYEFFLGYGDPGVIIIVASTEEYARHRLQSFLAASASYHRDVDDLMARARMSVHPINDVVQIDW